MIIKANERVLLAGKTGSGKTWFAERLLIPVQRLIVIDPKATLAPWSLIEPGKRQWSQFDRGGAGRFRILPPVADDIDAWYEELFEHLYEAGDLTVYIDEAYAVAPPGSKPGKWLSALYTRGRERGIGVWAATQRPAWIPLFLISEADWLIIFRLNLEADRRRLASIAGDEVMGRVPNPHGFFLYNVEEGTPHYFRTTVLKSKKGV
jgi:DNA helicase HerA-like ATPase